MEQTKPLHEDLKALGAKTEVPDTPSIETIEIFQNPGVDEVVFETEEFSSLCPKTGQPDWAKVTIVYTPMHSCIESKSLKLYLQSYRSYKGFAEALAVKISKDLFEACKPGELTVSLKFTARGGVSICASNTLQM